MKLQKSYARLFIIYYIIILYIGSAATVTVGNANLCRSHLQHTILYYYAYDKIVPRYLPTIIINGITIVTDAVNRSATISFCE